MIQRRHRLHLPRFVAFLACCLAAPLALATAANAQELQSDCDAGQRFTAGELEITDAYSRATLPRAPVGGGYLTIANHGQSADRLVAVASPMAETVQLHSMQLENQVMKMEQVGAGGIVIPAGGSVSLTPGALHIMFIGVKAPFEEGGCVPVELTFELAGKVSVLLGIGGVAAGGDHSVH